MSIDDTIMIIQEHRDRLRDLASKYFPPQNSGEEITHMYYKGQYSALDQVLLHLAQGDAYGADHPYNPSRGEPNGV